MLRHRNFPNQQQVKLRVLDILLGIGKDMRQATKTALMLHFANMH